MGDLNKTNYQEQKLLRPNTCIHRNNLLSQRNVGCWAKQQQKKYIQFLSFSRKSLQSRCQRKNTKVFKHMALYIGSRDAIQCRSHHMKQLKIHKQLRKVIENFYQYNQGDDHKRQISNPGINHEVKNLQEIKDWQIEANNIKDQNYQQEDNFVMFYPTEVSLLPNYPVYFIFPEICMQQIYIDQYQPVWFSK